MGTGQWGTWLLFELHNYLITYVEFNLNFVLLALQFWHSKISPVVSIKAELRLYVLYVRV